MRLHQLLACELVQVRGEPLRPPAGVAEDECASVLAYEVEDLRLDVRPDARPGLRLDASVRWRLGDQPEAAHVLDRDDDLDVEVLAAARVDHGDRAWRDGGGPAEEARDLVERSLRRGEADTLWWALDDLLEALE